ncbi:MAG: thioredoxin family protein [Candidatus Bathyarchaeia archaeon]
MRLRLFTLPTCPKCPEAKKLVEEIACARKDVIVEVFDMSIPENLTTALMLQVASAPSICIDDDLVVAGEVPSFDELNMLIDEYKNRPISKPKF